jgi:hypothetical protein
MGGPNHEKFLPRAVDGQSKRWKAKGWLGLQDDYRLNIVPNEVAPLGEMNAPD